MNRKDIILNGDAAVRKALSGMCVILNENGELLSRLDGDRMAFRPVLECDEKCSAILFDDPLKAKGVIEEILQPQENGGYNIFKFTSIGEPEHSDDGMFEIEYDSDDLDDDDGSMFYDDEEDDDEDGEDDNGDLDVEISEDDVKEIKKVISELRELEDSEDASSDVDYGRVADLLETMIEDVDDGEDDDSLQESVGKCPTMREAQRIFKRNGYQLVSQKGSNQKWVKPGDNIPIILPYHSRDNEQVRPGDWKSIIKEHNLRLDA